MYNTLGYVEIICLMESSLKTYIYFLFIDEFNSWSSRKEGEKRESNNELILYSNELMMKLMMKLMARLSEFITI